MVQMITLVKHKKISLAFSKKNTKLCSSLHCNSDESYLYANKTKMCKFEANDNISLYNLCFGTVPKYFRKDEQSKISLKSSVMIFHLAIAKSNKQDILNTHQYLMV